MMTRTAKPKALKRSARPARATIKETVRPDRAAQEQLYRALLAAAKENPLRLFNVKDIRMIFHIPDKAMRHYRRLAEQDRATDPWEGDRTSVTKFDGWYWNVRVRLENEFPNTK